jgi:hypothetical protein
MILYHCRYAARAKGWNWLDCAGVVAHSSAVFNRISALAKGEFTRGICVALARGNLRGISKGEFTMGICMTRLLHDFGDKLFLWFQVSNPPFPISFPAQNVLVYEKKKKNFWNLYSEYPALLWAHNGHSHPDAVNSKLERIVDSLPPQGLELETFGHTSTPL